MTTQYTGETINLEPTTYGYENISIRFIQSILSDVHKGRKKDSEALMKSIVQTVFYLGSLAGKAAAAEDQEAYDEAIAGRDRIMENTF